MLDIATVNALSIDDFVARFGDVAEHSPWVAEAAARARPFATREAMIEAFAAVVAAVSREARLALIRVHPDLALGASPRASLNLFRASQARACLADRDYVASLRQGIYVGPERSVDFGAQYRF